MKALGKGSIASIVQVGLSFAWIVLWVVFIAWAAVGGQLFGVHPAHHNWRHRSGDNSTIDSSDQIHIQIQGIDPGALRELKWTDWHIFAPAILVGGVTIGGSLIIVGRLRRLFDSFSTGDPFRRENATHLRVIWITMVAIELSRYVLLATARRLLGMFGAPDSVAKAPHSASTATTSRPGCRSSS
jgi:hypothetical protein